MKILNNNVAKYHFSKKSGLLIASLLLSSQSYAEIRDITFQNLSVRTTDQGTELYNNGRMQKPIVVKYSAYLADDLANQAPVELTEEEAVYYLKFAEYGEARPQPIEYLNPQVKISKTVNQNYDMNINTASQGRPLRSRRSLPDQGIFETTFYLSYEGVNAYDTVNQLEICVYGNPERRGDYNSPISGYPNKDCANKPSSKRLINVISGAYASTISKGASSEANAINLQTVSENLCTSNDDCDSYKIFGGQSNDIRDILVTEHQFSSRRPHHKLRPVNTDENPIKLIANGCIDGSDYNGTCAFASGWDLYKTWSAFGDSTGITTKYSTGDDDILITPNTYKHNINNYKTGMFSIISVLLAVREGDAADGPIKGEEQTKMALHVQNSGHWAAPTRRNQNVSQLIEDNYGNQFRLEATIIPNQGLGANNNEGIIKVYDQIDESSINITSIY
ncbi:hypothetical protein AB6D66_26545 [Vibrio pomeroyi]|uniref:Uncharacterized protein n=1 Tax=Vibrio pomeroyi TaxID=198832 RepID=A0ABV4N5Y1_9VIBR